MYASKEEILHFIAILKDWKNYGSYCHCVWRALIIRMLHCLSSLLVVRISVTGISCKKTQISLFPDHGCHHLAQTVSTRESGDVQIKKKTLQKPLKVSSWKGCIHLFFAFLEKQENILLLATTKMHCRLVDVFSCQTSQSHRGKPDLKQSEKNSSVQSP